MHIMLDLETMGTRPNAPIVSIGAVAFDSTGESALFYRTVSLRSSVESGAVIDPNTVEWWLQQSDDARAALVGDITEPLEPCLRALGQFVATYGDDLVGVWGNGAAFDNVIIHESCRRLGMAPLWEFWKDKCYRTVKGAYPKVPLSRTGDHHNALDDARTQVAHLIDINSAAGGVFL